MNRWLKWSLVVILLILMGAGGFIAGKFYWDKDKSDKDSEKAATSSAKKSDNKSAAEEAESDLEGCWKDYENAPVGYKLKYPCDWTLKETSEFNETIETTVKHITLTTPDSKYFLYWGFIKTGVEGYTNNDRTGVGAGDFVVKPAMAFDILGVNVVPQALVFQGKIKEYFYKQPQAGIATCACNFIGMFSYNQSQDYDALDMTNLEYVQTVKQILQSVQKI